MFLLSKRNRIIKKAVAKTVSEFADRTPKIYQHFFYGAVDIAPCNLAIWYLFETDEELKNAQESGYCDELKEATVRNLTALGYPKEAFVISYQEVPMDKIIFEGGTEEQRNSILKSISMRHACVSFTTKEDIDNKAHGDYHAYFQ